MTHVNWVDIEEEISSNHMELRPETDKVLSSHLQTSPVNACYKTQNEFIEVTGKHIHNGIIAEVMTNKHYTPIADEVSDASNKQQLSVSLFGDVVKETCQLRFC